MTEPRYHHIIRAAIATVLLVGGALVHGTAAARDRPRIATMPLSSVRAGMICIGYTVFQGTTIDTFSVSILGVLRDYRPGSSLILARAHNPFLEKTGIIAGMSGSPIYVGGRLIGALSYTWGFLKEPVAGITPVEEMLELLPGDDTPRENRDDLELGALPEGDDAASSRWARAEGLAGQERVDGIRPISTPVMVSGFSEEALRFLNPWFRDRGMIAVPGGAPTGSMDCDSLVGGAAVGAQLVRGDWNAAAIGTVTLRDKDRLLAFGHPFTSMGWIDFPLTGAEITTVMPSAQVSNKVGSATNPCGALLVDRQAGIAAKVGPVPAMIPVRVVIRGAGGRERLYRYEVVRHRLLTPGLVAGIAVSSVSTALYDVGLCTVRYAIRSYWNGGTKTGRRGNAFLSNAPVAGVGEQIDQSLTLLLGEHFRPSRLDSAVIDIDVQDGIDALQLTAIRPSTQTAAPGESLWVEATFRRSGRGIESRKVAIRIPPSAPEGNLILRVCGGEETDRWEQGRAPDRYNPRSLDDLLAIYRDERRADHLYVQLYAETPGAVIGGGEIPQAPRSVLSVLGAKGKEGEGPGVKGATLAERAYDLQRVIRGCETATITISADHRR
jgi:hypothetical protein